jgi:hypothetical protein
MVSLLPHDIWMEVIFLFQKGSLLCHMKIYFYLLAYHRQHKFFQLYFLLISFIPLWLVLQLYLHQPCIQIDHLLQTYPQHLPSLQISASLDFLSFLVQHVSLELYPLAKYPPHHSHLHIIPYHPYHPNLHHQRGYFRSFRTF